MERLTINERVAAARRRVEFKEAAGWIPPWTMSR
jgi:hypothetical protein